MRILRIDPTIAPGLRSEINKIATGRVNSEVMSHTKLLCLA